MTLLFWNRWWGNNRNSEQRHLLMWRVMEHLHVGEMEICGEEPTAVQFSQKFWKFKKDFVRVNNEMSWGCVLSGECSQMEKFVKRSGWTAKLVMHLWDRARGLWVWETAQIKNGVREYEGRFWTQGLFWKEVESSEQPSARHTCARWGGPQQFLTPTSYG